MTTIRLDAAAAAAAAAALRAAEGRVRLCDPDGKLVREAELAASPGEPRYTAEEWRAIIDDPAEFTTAEVLEYAKSREGR